MLLAAAFPTQNGTDLVKEKSSGNASWRKNAHFSLLRLDLRSEVFSEVCAEASFHFYPVTPFPSQSAERKGPHI